MKYKNSHSHGHHGHSHTHRISKYPSELVSAPQNAHGPRKKRLEMLRHFQAYRYYLLISLYPDIMGG